jgi:hypothetical protein
MDIADGAGLTATWPPKALPPKIGAQGVSANVKATMSRILRASSDERVPLRWG